MSDNTNILIKQDLKVIINAIVDSKTLPTVQNRELALLANMLERMGEPSSSSIESEIQDRIDELTVASPIKNVLLLALGVSNTIEKGSYVNTIDDLPDISDPDINAVYQGSIFFIVENASLVFCGNQKWIGFDGAVLLNLGPEPLVPGTVWTWGYNDYGQLGDSTTVNKNSRVSVVGGFTDWIDLSSSGDRILALRENGTLWGWGNNSFGKIGDGTGQPKSSPVSIVGGFTDWKSFSAQPNASFGIRDNGTIWGWGANAYGLIGDGTTIDKSSPVSIVGGFMDWRSVNSNGVFTSVALRDNGTIWTWGRNAQGQLGDGTTVDKSSPVSIVGGFMDWILAASSDSTMFGIRENGTLWGWGDNYYGAIGDGTTVDKSSPVSIVGGFTDWSFVTGGYSVAAALRENGTLWAWGVNAFGGLGDNTTLNKSSPVSVVGGFTDWVDVRTTGLVTTGLREYSYYAYTYKQIRTWGYNYYGQLGDGTTYDRSSPVLLYGGYTDWVKIGNHSAIRPYVYSGY